MSEEMSSTMSAKSRAPQSTPAPVVARARPPCRVDDQRFQPGADQVSHRPSQATPSSHTTLISPGVPMAVSTCATSRRPSLPPPQSPASHRRAQAVRLQLPLNVRWLALGRPLPWPADLSHCPRTMSAIPPEQLLSLSSAVNETAGTPAANTHLVAGTLDDLAKVSRKTGEPLPW
jgi:hypothetical protein